MRRAAGAILGDLEEALWALRRGQLRAYSSRLVRGPGIAYAIVFHAARRVEVFLDAEYGSRTPL